MKKSIRENKHLRFMMGTEETDTEKTETNRKEGGKPSNTKRQNNENVKEGFMIKKKKNRKLQAENQDTEGTKIINRKEGGRKTRKIKEKEVMDRKKAEEREKRQGMRGRTEGTQIIHRKRR